MIQTNLSITLESFTVPDTVMTVMTKVTPQKAPTIGPRPFLLSEIPFETLSKMCDEFKAEVFKRAGK